MKFEKTDLAFAYRTQLVKAGGRPQGAFATGVATKQLKGNDCDRDDSCLKQLALGTQCQALYTGTLYEATFARPIYSSTNKIT